MTCPACGKNEDRVIDSRENDHAIRRRRACGPCGHRWTTYERAEVWVDLARVRRLLTDALATVNKGGAVYEGEG